MTDFCTIGHSTRTLPEFVALLQGAQVRLLVDVRSVPRSRTNPQFNADTLPAALAQAGIGYCRLAALGGLRSHRKSAPPSPNGWWENASFRNYADYAQTAAFAAGLQELLALGANQRCAIMCAEAVWWRCHRRIIADYLLIAGQRVFHIMDHGKLVPASLTPAAVHREDGSLVYPPAA